MHCARQVFGYPGYFADRCSSRIDLVGCLTWLSYPLSRFACQALAVHVQGLSCNLDALRSQSRFQAPRERHYVIVLIGCGITILMQSSSVSISTLTPLVAVGPLRLDKMFRLSHLVVLPSVSFCLSSSCSPFSRVELTISSFAATRAVRLS